MRRREEGDAAALDCRAIQVASKNAKGTAGSHARLRRKCPQGALGVCQRIGGRTLPAAAGSDREMGRARDLPPCRPPSAANRRGYCGRNCHLRPRLPPFTTVDGRRTECGPYLSGSSIVTQCDSAKRKRSRRLVVRRRPVIPDVVAAQQSPSPKDYVFPSSASSVATRSAAASATFRSFSRHASSTARTNSITRALPLCHDRSSSRQYH